MRDERWDGGRLESARALSLSPVSLFSFSSLTNSSAVSVSGGRGRQDPSISAIAADQLPWQSKSVEIAPPLMMPGKAWYLDASRVRASRPPPGARKEARRRPSGEAGPQPKHWDSGV